MQGHSRGPGCRRSDRREARAGVSAGESGSREDESETRTKTRGVERRGKEKREGVRASRRCCHSCGADSDSEAQADDARQQRGVSRKRTGRRCELAASPLPSPPPLSALCMGGGERRDAQTAVGVSQRDERTSDRPERAGQQRTTAAERAEERVGKRRAAGRRCRRGGCHCGRASHQKAINVRRVHRRSATIQGKKQRDASSRHEHDSKAKKLAQSCNSRFPSVRSMLAMSR